MKFSTLTFGGSLLLASLGFSQSIGAQDVFSTGKSARDYNYIQATYLINRRNIDLPILLEAQLSINPNFSLKVEYLNASEKPQAIVTTFVDEQNRTNNLTTNIKAKSTSVKAGIGFNIPSKRWSQIDWFSELLFERFELKTSGSTTVAATDTLPEFIIPGDSTETEIDSLIARLGFRYSITPPLEVQATLSMAYTDSEIEREQLNLLAAYRVTNRIDVALLAFDATDNPNYNLGFRYNW